MNEKVNLSFLFILSLFFSSFTFANANQVEGWTQKTLVETLAIDYTGNEKLFARMRPSYSYNAWNALGEFLGEYKKVVANKRLSLHPQAVGPATIVNSGIVKNSNFFAGVRYWRINQAVSLPELNIIILFGALVIKTQDGEYLITSLDMSKKEAN